MDLLRVYYTLLDTPRVDADGLTLTFRHRIGRLGTIPPYVLRTVFYFTLLQFCCHIHIDTEVNDQKSQKQQALSFVLLYRKKSETTVFWSPRTFLFGILSCPVTKRTRKSEAEELVVLHCLTQQSKVALCDIAVLVHIAERQVKRLK